MLPRPVIEEAAAELVDYQGSGVSVLEVSHRAAAYDAVHRHAMEAWRRVYALPSDLEVLLLQGGASTQFAMVPLNLIRPSRSADYICTGSWSVKAAREAAAVGRAHRVAASSEDRSFRYIPTQAQLDLDDNAEYVHITTNNTIYGTQFQGLPDAGGVWLVADMSSDILSGPVAWDRIGLAYGSAQKNAGIAGLTVVCVRRALLDREPADIPTMLRYSTHAGSASLHNTPPTFAVYVLGLVLRWIEDNGGLGAMAARNRQKAELLYRAIDGSGGFYRGHAEESSRSCMNVTFTLRDESLEATFFGAAEQNGLRGLKGHRQVGGVRASIYNGMPMEGCRALAGFMQDFARARG